VLEVVYAVKSALAGKLSSVSFTAVVGMVT
jgi:hypothetical protein